MVKSELIGDIEGEAVPNEDLLGLDDLGLIIRTDGTFSVFGNQERGDEMTHDDQVKTKVEALILALSNDQVMDILFDLLEKSGFRDLEPEQT